MQYLNLSDRVRCLRVMMAFHARRRLTVCAIHSLRELATPYVVLLVCLIRDMMACHSRRRLTICVVQGLCWHATLDFVRLCVMSKVHDVHLRPMLYDYVLCPRSMILCLARHRLHVCSTRTMIECHARHPYTMCAAQGILCPTMLEVLQSCVLSKGYDGMPCVRSSDRVSCQNESMK